MRAIFWKELVREFFEYQRSKLKLVRYWQMSYKCPACHRKGRSVIVRASVPKPLLNHILFAASVVVEIMYQKYVNAMPLYRQEAAWKQLGDAMRKELLEREVLHADKTVVQVLKENGKTAQSKSYMWVYRTGMDGLPPIVLYEYQLGRSGEYPKKLLEGFHGYLHTDGYAGYNQVPDITRCGCWAHLRRKFVEAMPAASSNPKEFSRRHRLARNIVTSCLQLKRNLAELPAEERQKQRLAVEKPMLRAFWCWLEEREQQPLAGNLKKAVQYARKHQPYMENYLLDLSCQISNNFAENAIRPFTVGRKNWLLSDTVKGAKASAVIYSLVETAGANGLSERGYLHIVLSHLPSMDFRQHPELLKDLMPWSDYMRSCFEQK